MGWIDSLGTALGYIATFLGGGWLLNLYTAKPKKNSMEIENLRSVIDELQDVIKQNSENSKEYRKNTNEEIAQLKKEVRDLSLRVDIKHEAIYSSSRCEFIKSTEDCIVMQTFREKCNECLNKNKEN